MIMSDIAIISENLGKKFQIGALQQYETLRDRVAAAFRPRAGGSRPKDAEVIWALKDVNFKIKQGEVVGVIGRNGAGKSTLLKILSKITEPTVGRVELHGRVGSLLEVGTGFHQELTGRENVFLNGAILGMRREEIKRRFDEIVAFSEVERFIDTPVKHYSSGMYMRLAFAVAAFMEPEILLVDEVLAVGDAQFQKKCLGKMGEVATQGRTILFVSHNMSAVRSLCGRTILLDSGSIAFEGSTIQAIDQYLTDNQEKNSYNFALGNIPRTGHFGSKLRINQIRFNGGSGVWHGQPMEVDIDFECLADVEEVSFGVGFCTRSGVRILSFDSDVPGDRRNFARGEAGNASFSLPVLHLEPDTYNLDIGSRSGDNFGLDYLPQCGCVLVQPSGATPPVIAMRESGRGGIRIPTEWRYQTVKGNSASSAK